MEYLDTRDLAKRQEELQSELDSLQEAIEEANEPADNGEYGSDEADELAQAEQELEEWQEEYQQELDELNSLENELSEWSEGNTLIPESEWVDYVQDLLTDIGDLPRNIPWYIAIDWEKTAENIAQDYSLVTYQKEDYYVRNC